MANSPIDTHDQPVTLPPELGITPDALRSLAQQDRGWLEALIAAGIDALDAIDGDADNEDSDSDYCPTELREAQEDFMFGHYANDQCILIDNSRGHDGLNIDSLARVRLDSEQ